MKVSINCKKIEGPYGGVITFSRSLEEYLIKGGHSVVNHLDDDDIDIILLVAYATWMTASYSYLDALAYKIIHPRCLIVQRINECDERKETKYMNKLLVSISKVSDFVVFVGSWLKPLMENNGLPKNKPTRVIVNGANEKFFNKASHVWDGKSKLRIVTHHWGGGYLKGHEIYKHLDNLLDSEYYKNKFEFSFIGNYPSNLKYKNTKLIPPLTGSKLAEELKKNDVYLTASLNEPGGMHSVEGGMCGLPILYINSGCLPEYCSGYGIEFNKKNFDNQLEKMRQEYGHWKEKIDKYDQNSTRMNESYCNLFLELLSEKKCSNKIFLSYLVVFILRVYSKIDSLILRIRMKIN